MAGRVLEMVAMGTLLVATVLSVLALNTAWAKTEMAFDDDEILFGYAPLSFRAGFEGDSQRMPYSNEGFDDAGGIGMARAGGILFLLGTIMAGVAALVAEHHLTLGQKWLAASTALASGLATALLITALVLLPVGISDLAKEPQALATDEITWTFGLYAGIVASASALAATVVATIRAIRAWGFRLHPVEEAAGFDG